MPTAPTKDDVLDAIRLCAQELEHSPSRAEFKSRSKITEHHILRYFDNWSDAVRAAGLKPNLRPKKLTDEELLVDWGKLVRSMGQIPTGTQYRRRGTYSHAVFEKSLGPWSSVPAKFKEFAQGVSEWADVIALLPTETALNGAESKGTPHPISTSRKSTQLIHRQLADRQIYGNPIDFRGLRHEPVNENGVVFLFGMVARELGYSVEVVQAGFPDCEAKRQTGFNKWQRVRIEFEFESRNFREHGHPPEGCDIIVCWRHNWPECPLHIEVVELQSIITMLAKTES